MLAARLPGNSAYDNLRHAGPPDTGGCLITHSSLTALPTAPLPPNIKGRHISLISGHVRMVEA